MSLSSARLFPLLLVLTLALLTFWLERLTREYDFRDFARALDDAQQGRAIKPILRME